MENLTIKQKEFLKALKDLLIKYNADIGWTCDDCSDTYGLYDDHLYVSICGQKDIDFCSNGIDVLDIDDMLEKELKENE